jgi:uncharacterized protein YbaP (TraB family)
MKTAVIAIVTLLFASGNCLAQDTPPPTTDWKMEVVVVEANQKGPALWHLKKGDSEIWILGTVGMMPKDIAWNTARLTEVIDGANQVLLPPQAKTGYIDIFEMGWFFMTHWGVLSMPDGHKLEPSLQPDLRARFVKAREAVGKNADRYEDRKPMIAGFMLLSDYAQKAKMAHEIPEEAVEKIAHVKHVKVRRVAEYDAMPLVKEMLKLGPDKGLGCFENALSDYEVKSVHAIPAAEAWAVGNVAGIKAHYSTSMLESCVKQSKKYGELDNRAVGDMTKALHEALSKPGKTVMVIDIGSMFRASGVAEQLKAEGVTIEGPGE